MRVLLESIIIKMLKAKDILVQFSHIKSLPQRRKERQKFAKDLSIEELKNLIENFERQGSKTAWDLISHLITSKLSD